MAIPGNLKSCWIGVVLRRNSIAKRRCGQLRIMRWMRMLAGSPQVFDLRKLIGMMTLFRLGATAMMSDYHSLPAESNRTSVSSSYSVVQVECSVSML